MVTMIPIRISIPLHSALYSRPTNQLVDCLSRLDTHKDNFKLPKLHLYQITNQLNARSDSLNQL